MAPERRKCGNCLPPRSVRSHPIDGFTALSTNGSGGNRYSITPFGPAWPAESDCDDFVSTEPGHFAAMLKPFQQRFGPQFYERVQEAVR